MKLGSFFIICKPSFQVPNKTLECLFEFQITWMIAEIRASFVLVQFFFFTNKGSVLLLLFIIIIIYYYKCGKKHL